MLLLAEVAVDQLRPGAFLLLDQVGDVLRRQLQIVIDRDGVVAVDLMEPAEGRIVLPKVAREANGNHLGRIFRLEVGEHVPALIAAAVVDEDHLERLAHLVEHRFRAAEELRKRVLAVVDGNDDRVADVS